MPLIGIMNFCDPIFITSVCSNFLRVELHRLVRGIVLWRFLLEIMAGSNIVRMVFSIPLMLPSACSPGEISLKSFVWPV